MTDEQSRQILKEAANYRWLRDQGFLDSWWSMDLPSDRCASIDSDIEAAMLEDIQNKSLQNE